MRHLTIVLCLAAIVAAESSFSQQAVFPLHIGNRWEYSGFNSLLAKARITRDTLMPNGMRYAVVDSVADFAWPLNFTYLRNAGDTVYHYNTASQTEEVLYRFDASPGDTLLKVTTPLDTFAIVFHSQQTAQVFGIQRRQWLFSIFPMHVLDVGHARIITDSLGLTHLDHANGTSTLGGALINGAAYGNITSATTPPTLPASVALHQNFPNPFNPVTTIAFDLPNQSDVLLDVYDLLGRRIGVLVNSTMPAGRHTVAFGPANLASGVYVYRLQVDGIVLMKKLLMAK